MTSAMDLPLFGKVKLSETNKAKLLEVWNNALDKNDLKIQEHTKVQSIDNKDDYFVVSTNTDQQITAKNVLLSYR